MAPADPQLDPTPPRRRFVRRHPFRAGALFLASGFVFLNVLAYRQAYSLTHFYPGHKFEVARYQGLGGKLDLLWNGLQIPRPQNRETPAEEELEFDTRLFQASDGIELEAWHVAASRPQGVVVLLHGYAASKSQLLPIARELRAMGYSSLMVDFRGSGGSEGVESTVGMHEGRDVAAAIAHARQLLPGKEVVVYGISMGAVAALRAVDREGARPDRLILHSSFDRFLSTVRHRFQRLGLPGFPTAELLVLWGGIQQGENGFAHNPVEYAASVSCPTLMLQGGADWRVTVAEAESLHQALATSAKSLHVFPELGHQLFLTEEPEEWRRVVGGFLEAEPAATN